MSENMSIEEALVKLDHAKQMLKDWKAEDTTYGNIVKEYLEGHGLDNIQLPNVGIKCSYKESVKSETNEEQLIKIINNLVEEVPQEYKQLVKDCVEYKPTVNEDKIQQLIYQGIISVDDIAPAIIEKPYKTLRLGKCKKVGE